MPSPDPRSGEGRLGHGRDSGRDTKAGRARMPQSANEGPGPLSGAASGASEESDGDSGSRAADRIFSLLDALAASPRGMGLTAVAREAGLPKATAYRLLAALKRL